VNAEVLEPAFADRELASSAPVDADTRLRVEDRPARRELDRDGDKHEERRQHGEGDAAEHQIYGAVQSVRALTRDHIEDGFGAVDFSNCLDRPRTFDRLSIDSLRSSRTPCSGRRNADADVICKVLVGLHILSRLPQVLKFSQQNRTNKID